MSRPILLDSGPLGRLAHPSPRADITAWFQQLLVGGAEIVLPEIADYEVRRNLILTGLQGSLVALNDLRRHIRFLPIDSAVMLRAAELWADARRAGKATADPRELDGDVILAAQALSIGGVVATENLGHLTQFVSAYHWRRLAP